MTVSAVILGSSFSQNPLKLPHSPLQVDTSWGQITLYKTEAPIKTSTKTKQSSSYIIYRHGLPHTVLPHQINFRGYIEALKTLGCTSLLLTSSVGVLSAEIPLYTPLLAYDLLMPFNRLPTGEVCTLFPTQTPHQGHLVLQEGLFSHEINHHLEDLISKIHHRHQSSPSIPDSFSRPSLPKVTFAYVPGPRTKTKAENRFWRLMGAEVNSMSIGPEVVLANEAQIPTAALLVGHKYSLDPDQISTQPHLYDVSRDEIKDSLVISRQILEESIIHFLQTPLNPSFKNTLYHFD